MQYQTIRCSSEADWLSKRQIGGSDAGALMGDGFRTNIDVYNEMKGLVPPADLSDNPLVRFGKLAEEHIRALFALENEGKYEVISPTTLEKDGYLTLYQSSLYPFLTATLDGELIRKEDGAHGVLEIKTKLVQSRGDMEDWDGPLGMPRGYYAQILHYMLVRDDLMFCVLCAELRHPDFGKGAWTERRTVCYQRAECKDDLYSLLCREVSFKRECLDKDTPPKLIKNFCI